MSARAVKLFINGKWEAGLAEKMIRHSPFSNEPVAQVEQADRTQMEAALKAAHDAFLVYRKSSRYLRSKLLAGMAAGIAARKQEFIASMIAEAGKPYALADIEVTRALTTFTVAAEEAKRLGGEVIPLDIEATARTFAHAESIWVPRGPVLGITPFNFPLNLVAHKVAPALAAGVSIIIKPAPQAPGCAALLAEVFEKAAADASDAKEQMPLAAFQVVSCSNDVAGAAVTDERITTVSFTGSTAVGWMLQGKAIGKRTLLELGGNAAAVIHSDADLDRAANRCATGGHAYAGQSCISVQRIYVQENVVTKFQEKLIAETAKVAHGDPARKETMVGPLIDTQSADRVMAWIDEAKKAGAKVLLGGKRTGNVIEPTILTHVPSTAKVVCEEVFGPVVVLEPYKDFKDAVAKVNHSKFGLQAGVFTHDLRLARMASEELEVGGVLINEIPTYRADHLPYGGVKGSGLGREGLRYAIEEYSERRTIIEWIG